jgi:hypothetical protein
VNQTNYWNIYSIVLKLDIILTWGFFSWKVCILGFFPLILKLYCFKVGHDFKHGALSPEMCAYCFFQLILKLKLEMNNSIVVIKTFDFGVHCAEVQRWCNVFRIGVVMVSVLASTAVDRGFEPRSGQAKDFKIGICCFSAKHAALRRKSKDWLARNQNNVSKWSDMSIRRLLFQWAGTIKIQFSVLV